MSRGRGRGGNRAPAPVETAEVVSLAHDGRGVAKIDGKAIFVAGALPGEQITLQRLRKQRSADEARLVEGVLRIEIAGRVLEGRAGDVFQIPKGSKIVFGTPNRVRVFYVTHPANWAGGGQAPRPQK